MSLTLSGANLNFRFVCMVVAIFRSSGVVQLRFSFFFDMMLWELVVGSCCQRALCFCEALTTNCAATWNHIRAEQKPQIYTKFVHLIQKVHVFPHLVFYDTVCWHGDYSPQLIQFSKRDCCYA